MGRRAWLETGGQMEGRGDGLEGVCVGGGGSEVGGAFLWRK